MMRPVYRRVLLLPRRCSNFLLSFLGRAGVPALNRVAIVATDGICDPGRATGCLENVQNACDSTVDELGCFYASPENVRNFILFVLRGEGDLVRRCGPLRERSMLMEGRFSLYRQVTH
jgi:hypothetical protein